MSTYSFKMTKDSTVNSSMPDVSVVILLDDVQVTSGTLGSSELTLTFTADLSAGNHKIKIKPGIVNGAVQLGTLTIDNKQVNATQWDLNNQISGTASTVRHDVARPISKEFSSVWWGTTDCNIDTGAAAPGPFNPCLIVCDHDSWWEWDFTVTDSKKIWFSHTGDTNSVLYDSTDDHRYYCVQHVTGDFITDPVTIDTYNDTLNDPLYGDSSAYDSGAFGWSFIGPGTYNDSLQYVSSSLDESAEDANKIVIMSANDFNYFMQYKYWHANNNLTVITVT